MAVYTKVSDKQVRDFISSYDIGEFIRIEPIKAGIDNSNYHLFTSKNRYILTIYESRINPADLSFFYDFQEHLVNHGINCPKTLRNINGDRGGILSNKPAAVISFLEGQEVKEITSDLCYQMGEVMAKMHIASMKFEQSLENSMGLKKWNSYFAQVKNKADSISEGLEKFIDEELNYLNENHPEDLVRCVTHTDMFPNNVFEKEGKICGIIDFYFSCETSMLYDFLITVNAWCFDKNNEIRLDYFNKMMQGYENVRKFTKEEVDAFPYMCRAACMRFLASRLYDWFNTPDDAYIDKHDPMEYVEKIKFYRNYKLLESF